MIAIGAKVDPSRPVMPGAAGSYSAIDSLRASLRAKEAELATLEAQLGPLWEGGVPSIRSYQRPLIIAGAAVGGLLVVYLLWTFLLSGLFSSSLPGWARQYVTKDTGVVVYANIEKLRARTSGPTSRECMKRRFSTAGPSLSSRMTSPPSWG